MKFKLLLYQEGYKNQLQLLIMVDFCLKCPYFSTKFIILSSFHFLFQLEQIVKQEIAFVILSSAVAFV